MHAGRLALEYARFLNDNIEGLPDKKKFFDYIKNNEVVYSWEIGEALMAFDNFEIEIVVKVKEEGN